MKAITLKRAIIAIAMMLITAASSWAYDFTVGGIYYNKNSDGTTVYVTYKNTNYNSYSGSVVIPSTVTYSGTTYSVTSIGSNAFKSCSGLTSVTIGNSVTSIGYSAFYGCSGLTAVTIPNSVTEIGNYAFDNCTGLTSVTIPNSVTSIGEYAFYNCTGLTSVTIPNSVTSIGEYAFYNCTGLTSVTIGNSVTSIGYYAFRDCSGLTSVTIGNSVTSIGYSAFSNCSGLTSVTIPNSVTSIGKDAFSGCSGLTKVEISDIASLCNISFSSYSSNPLYYAKHLYLNETEVTNLVIPNSVTSIGNYAFDGCSGLTSVTIPNSVTLIGNYAFDGCSGLTSVTIPNSVTSIGVAAFKQCTGLTSVTIGNSVTSIGDNAFYRCSGLTLVSIGNSVTSIGESAFDNCTGLISVTIPNSVTSIGDKAFLGCSGLTSVTIPNSVTSIGSYTFSSCYNLEMVKFNATISNIPTNNVFGSNKDLSFIVGEEVVSIPNNIVYNGGSGGVSKVIALVDTPPTATGETFDSSVTSTATLYVKKNSVSKYFLADGWSDFTNIQAISNPVTQISLDNTSLILSLGEAGKLTATVEPADATLTDVIWTASNSCVSVDQNGNIKGLSEGQCIVTAEAIDGSGIKAECIVNVGSIYAESISLNKEVVALDINGITKLSYTILPENATIKDVECSSSDESVAVCKVNSDKTITVLGLSSGVTTITVRTTDGTNRSASCVFYVGDSGAETIDSNSVKVTTEGGAIRVDGADGAVAEVYSLSGVMLYRGTDATIVLPRGVYIVKVAGTTTKVVL